MKCQRSLCYSVGYIEDKLVVKNLSDSLNKTTKVRIEMPINSDVPYLPDSVMESRALALLQRYESQVQPVRQLPIPVEKIADLLLELVIDWDVISDTDDAPVLAYLNPTGKKICFNESRRAHFDQFYGSYEYTLAHELGHHELHISRNGAHQLTLFENGGVTCVYGKKMSNQDRRELQAEIFASYLLLPQNLLGPALEGVDLLRWPNLYRLRDKFHVSITALTRRLMNLNRLYVDREGNLYPSKEDASGQMRLS